MDSRNRGNREDEEVALLGHHQEFRIEKKIYGEPETHRKNRPKTCKEKMMPCLPANSADGCELTPAECDAFGEECEKMRTGYDKTLTAHEAKLKQLFEEFVKRPETEIDPATMKSKDWGLLGFQGEDPRTDFRGGGITSLKNILAFCRNHPDKLAEIKEQVAKGLYLFACSSIGTTFFLKNYFHMGEDPSQHLREPLANRRAFKTFCSLLVKEENVIKRLHDGILIAVFDLWTRACAANPQLTIIDSGSAEAPVRAKFKEIMETRGISSVQEVLQKLQNSHFDPSHVTKFTIN